MQLSCAVAADLTAEAEFPYASVLVIVPYHDLSSHD